jgi:hypothetical protein
MRCREFNNLQSTHHAAYFSAVIPLENPRRNYEENASSRGCSNLNPSSQLAVGWSDHTPKKQLYLAPPQLCLLLYLLPVLLPLRLPAAPAPPHADCPLFYSASCPVPSSKTIALTVSSPVTSSLQ